MKMAKQKLWYKKRTSRGGGRKVVGRPRLSRKNAATEIYKNQRVYSHFLLKFVIFALLGVVWIGIGAALKVGPIVIGIFPIGLAIGIVLICFERFRIGRGIEIAILLTMAAISYFLPIGLVI